MFHPGPLCQKLHNDFPRQKSIILAPRGFFAPSACSDTLRQNAPIVSPLTACCANSARQPSALRRWYFLCVSDAITHDLLSPYPGRPFCTSEKSGIQRRSVTAYLSGTFIACEKRVFHENDTRAFQHEKRHICDRIWAKCYTRCTNLVHGVRSVELAGHEAFFRRQLYGCK